MKNKIERNFELGPVKTRKPKQQTNKINDDVVSVGWTYEEEKEKVIYSFVRIRPIFIHHLMID